MSSKNPIARFQWNRTESQVELFDDESNKNVRRSHNTATFKRPVPTVDHFVHRGSINKCSSQVEFKSEGEKEEWTSTTQLGAPGVVYGKTNLPVRTGSKVTMGRERLDYDTSTLGAYSSNARIQPPTCPGRTAWNRTHSKVPLGGEAEPFRSTSATTHTNLLPLIYGTDSAASPTKFSKSGSQMRILQKAAHADPNLTESTPTGPEPTDMRPSGATGQILRGSINKCSSIVDINNGGEPGEGFVSHNSENFMKPAKEALWKGPGPHMRTRSDWIPGSSEPDFGTTAGLYHNGDSSSDTLAKRFSWKRTASNVKLTSGETALPAPHYASTHVRMQDTVGSRVLRGDVNKCASTIKLTMP